MHLRRISDTNGRRNFHEKLQPMPVGYPLYVSTAKVSAEMDLGF